MTHWTVSAGRERQADGQGQADGQSARQTGRQLRRQLRRQLGRPPGKDSQAETARHTARATLPAHHCPASPPRQQTDRGTLIQPALPHHILSYTAPRQLHSTTFPSTAPLPVLPGGPYVIGIIARPSHGEIHTHTPCPCCATTRKKFIPRARKAQHLLQPGQSL
ncbi:uncharacterized protein CYBJADRAFT_27853 [Cyberlindnera jadinii NRRL Y-1542]|uniref:Uncharacterized protein n=1 Tax=Cyberlindnera jadinii (strain ATCC 18201 / CBS 1600 / BCRC 20928 / JCM 3617 / NBRC 0987 / NRRL Y-1542) TaxID=983966 RepID=A0A1E4RWY1_CYBJN|nr:hypothetical protein CYBJADRAFT_27853 [Cyberlindnera jadinii NRRL Y-1542]ODV71778.1 hypothetical protein CYBJADRAFT_27853 [Cyberlindnera jadinii NRRL Y-1542]